MKQAMLNLMMAGGVFAPFRLANRGKAVILTYHRFGEDDIGSKTSARLFADQLEYLCRYYNIVPLSTIANCLVKHQEIPAYSVAITIDDGYGDAYEIAYPLLKRFGVPATLFVVTDFVDGKDWIWTDKLRFLALQTGTREVELTIGNRKLRLGGIERKNRLIAAGKVNEALKHICNAAKEEAINGFSEAFGLELPDRAPEGFEAISWEQAREMSANGIEIGSHTVTHPILTQVDDDKLFREMGESKTRIENELKREAGLFCYPNGNYDSRVQLAVENAGYLCAVTTRHGFNDSNCHPLALGRIDAERDLAHFVQSTSGFEQVKNRLRRTRFNTVGVET